MAELTELQKQLFELQDIKYRDFHSKLMPETAKEKIIGIRTPVLRNFAKVFAGTPELEDFLQQLPHQFYEENNLHMMLITGIKDYPKCMEEVQRFLPYIDNWATCDFPEPKCFRKNKKAVLEDSEVPGYGYRLSRRGQQINAVYAVFLMDGQLQSSLFLCLQVAER